MLVSNGSCFHQLISRTKREARDSVSSVMYVRQDEELCYGLLILTLARALAVNRFDSCLNMLLLLAFVLPPPHPSTCFLLAPAWLFRLVVSAWPYTTKGLP